jgi:hypothetical protein
MLPSKGYIGVNRVNYAWPGAVTNKALAALVPIASGVPITVGDLTDQVKNFTTFNGVNAPGWTGANSLFFFPGSNTGNDIVTTWQNNGVSKVPAMIATISSQFDIVRRAFVLV